MKQVVLLEKGVLELLLEVDVLLAVLVGVGGGGGAGEVEEGDAVEGSDVGVGLGWGMGGLGYDRLWQFHKGFNFFWNHDVLREQFFFLLFQPLPAPLVALTALLEGVGLGRHGPQSGVALLRQFDSLLQLGVRAVGRIEVAIELFVRHELRFVQIRTEWRQWYYVGSAKNDILNTRELFCARILTI